MRTYIDIYVEAKSQLYTAGRQFNRAAVSEKNNNNKQL